MYNNKSLTPPTVSFFKTVAVHAKPKQVEAIETEIRRLIAKRERFILRLRDKEERLTDAKKAYENAELTCSEKLNSAIESEQKAAKHVYETTRVEAHFAIGKVLRCQNIIKSYNTRIQELKVTLKSLNDYENTPNNHYLK